jgi:hypothetical protein
MNSLFLHCPVEPLGNAVGLRLGDEGVARRYAPEPDLVTEVVRGVLRTVIHAQRQSAAHGGRSFAARVAAMPSSPISVALSKPSPNTRPIGYLCRLHVKRRKSGRNSRAMRVQVRDAPAQIERARNDSGRLTGRQRVRLEQGGGGARAHTFRAGQALLEKFDAFLAVPASACPCRGGHRRACRA